MEKRGDDKTGTGRVILPFAIRKGYVYYVDEQGNLREVPSGKGVSDKIKQEKVTGRKVTGFGAGPSAAGAKFAESGLKRYRNIYFTISMAALVVAIFALFKYDYFVLTLSAIGLALALIFFSIINNKIERVRILSGKKPKKHMERKFGEKRAKGLPAFIPIVFFIAAVACAIFYFINEESLYLILSGAIFVVFLIFFVIYLTIRGKGRPKKPKKTSWKGELMKKKKKEEKKIIAQKSLVLATKMKEDRLKHERRKAIHGEKSNIQLIFFFMAMALGVLGTISYFNRDYISMAVTGVVLILAMIVYMNFIKKASKIGKKKEEKKEEKKPEKEKEEKKEEKKIIAKKPEFKAKKKEKKEKIHLEPKHTTLRIPMIIAIVFFILSLALGVFAYLREDTFSLMIAGATLFVSFLLYIFFMMRLKRKKVAAKKARLHRIVRKAAKQRKIISKKAAGPLPKREFIESIREQEKLVTRSRIVPIFFLIIALGLGTLAFLKKESLTIVMAAAALLVIFVLLFAASRVDKKLKKQKMKIAIRQLRREKRGMETDIDLLLALLERFKKMKIREISYAFDIYEDKAEEWARILEEGGFAVMYYPAFGGVELRWKKR